MTDLCRRPPNISVPAPAAIAAAAPVLGWQPPSAPERDARSATTRADQGGPVASAVDHPLSGMPRASARPVSTAQQASAPAVGAATMTPSPVHLLHGERARRMSRNGVPANGPVDQWQLRRVAPTSPGADLRSRSTLRHRSLHDLERSPKAQARMSSTGRPDRVLPSRAPASRVSCAAPRRHGSRHGAIDTSGPRPVITHFVQAESQRTHGS